MTHPEETRIRELESELASSKAEADWLRRRLKEAEEIATKAMSEADKLKRRLTLESYY